MYTIQVRYYNYSPFEIACTREGLDHILIILENDKDVKEYKVSFGSILYEQRNMGKGNHRKWVTKFDYDK